MAKQAEIKEQTVGAGKAAKPFGICLPVKVMSVNKAWQGKRFKTPAYNTYERMVLMMLPAATLPEPPYRISFVFGMSNALSDWDNPVKPLQDILQKKYGFNDCHIQEAHVRKVKVSKGAEYFSCSIETIQA